MKIIEFFRKNGLILGLIRLFFRGSKRLLNYTSTLFWRISGVKMGRKTIIQYGVRIEYPKKVIIGNGCLLTQGTVISSENKNGFLLLEDNIQINKDVILDCTGGITIKSGSIISDGSIVYTHSHGYNPRSIPISTPIIIGENVWIGSRVMIMASVKEINEHSIVAAGSVVTKNINANSINGGNPSKIIKNRIES